MRNSLKRMCVFFLLIGSLISATTSVYAAEWFSDGGALCITVDNYTFAGSSVLIVEPDSEEGGSEVGAGVQVIELEEKTIPPSLIRAEPRLYLDGYLWLAEGWHYSSGNDFGLYAVDSTYFVSRSGRVFAQSIFGIYNGTGYTDYTAPRTITVNISSVTSRSMPDETPIQKEFAVNENGQTYGSGWNEETPELIKAIGIGGTKGYVYNAELLSLGDKDSLNSTPSNIPATIPLYASDGITIIGEFRIGLPND